LVSTNLYPNNKFPFNFFVSSSVWKEKPRENPNTIRAAVRNIFFIFIYSLLFQENLAQVGAMDSDMTDRAVCGVRIETAVPVRSNAMAAET
jgi:hypothetical protein